ncbi:zinc finger, CCHC-type containing protein [Tanacetum coccineum]
MNLLALLMFLTTVSYTIRSCHYINAINARRLPLAPLVYALVRPLVINDYLESWETIRYSGDKENYLEHPIPFAPVAQPGHQFPPEALELIACMGENFTLDRQGRKLRAGISNMLGMRKKTGEWNYRPCLKLHEEIAAKRKEKDANPALHAIRAGRVQKSQKNKPYKAGRGSLGKRKNKMGYAHINVPFAPKPKTPPPPKKDNPAKDAICHQCGEVGHWRRNCPVYLVELMKKKKLSQGASASGIFTIELYSFPSKS